MARPIIFSGPMVRALLAGRKTQTRRVLKLPTYTSGKNSHRIYEHPKMGGWEPTTSGGGGCFTIARDGSHVPYPERVAIWHRTCGECIETPYQAGDRLWVREAWKLALTEDDHQCAGYREGMIYGCGKPIPTGMHKWRPSIHMPRWASRLTLLVDNVKVERLQAISEDDAKVEGLRPTPSGWWSGADGQAGTTPQAAYALLWNSLHGPGAWDANPWVVAITFRVEQANIDNLREAA